MTTRNDLNSKETDMAPDTAPMPTPGTVPVTIRKEIRIDAPLDVVWQFVGTEEGLRRWWETDIRFEAHQGGRCSERVEVGSTRQWLSGTVTRYEPPRGIDFAFRSSSADGESADPDTTPAPIHSTVSIRLESTTEGTTVRVTHQIASIPVTTSAADSAQPVMSLHATGTPYMSLIPQPAVQQSTFSQLMPSRYSTQHMNAGVLHWQQGSTVQWSQRLATLKTLIEPVLIVT